ncbi:ABC transporter ATP-binding protein [hydrothermal vent metagenome]|uniref:ABC transporter ATP-binding protein n=1 Tax=hydrothermal vent metagenome TaxID=652676 RepID=A0A3B1CD55_9ZZZZ
MNLILKNISRTYDGHVALNDCSYSVNAGSFNAIIGPNGSGKSTLLRIASLLESPDKGDVIYSDNGVAVKKDLFLKRKIAVVLPGDSLFNETVFSNVAYGLRIRGMDRHVVRDRVHDILERFRLSDKIYKNARTLSSGEAQRIGVARALVTGPEYLFLDEPTASLDPVNTEIIEAALTGIKAGNGMTIIMITHNMFQAGRLADRVAFIYGGCIIEEADSERIFSDPEEYLTRRFVSGKMVW